MSNSTHKVEVVPVRLEPHPNADRLSIVKVYGYQVVVGTSSWLELPACDTEGTRLGAYVPPDSVVSIARPEFSFLAERANAAGEYRVKAQKLRGVVSFGLLVPAPAGLELGDDAAETLGVTHYEPPLEHERGKKGVFMGGEIASAPSGVVAPKYDLDAFRRYHHLFQPGERVLISEKLDGCLEANSDVLMSDGSLKAIKDVVPGDLVKSFNPETGCLEDKLVEAMWRKEPAGQWVELQFDNGRKLVCTDDHPILTGGGWKPAGQLTFEDEIISF